MGVDNHEWHPDRKVYIISSTAELRPGGWTNPVLYKIPVHQRLGMPVKEFFVIPKTLSKGATETIDTRLFPVKWISFIVSPTASLAMDSNMLYVLSNDGKNSPCLMKCSPMWFRRRTTFPKVMYGQPTRMGTEPKYE